MFFQRAIATFTIGPLIIYLVYLGGLFYFLPMLVILLLATSEYATMMRRMGWQVPTWLLLPVVLLLLAEGQWPNHGLLGPLMILGLFVTMGYALWLYEKQTSNSVPADWLALTTGVVLLGWLGSHFFRLRSLDHEMAWQWTALAMLVTWIADSGAYVVGKSMGKRKLSPRLSPNKTVEGYVGGIFFGVLFAALIGLWMGLDLTLAIVVGVLASVISPAGDLGISLLKREAGVKDSGNLLPGHGGALDRIDSLVWSMAMTYYLILFVG